jgi:hypothetical protein
MHEKPEPTPLGWPILPRHNQLSGSRRRAAGRNPAARSRTDARRYWGVRPDELRAAPGAACGAM